MSTDAANLVQTLGFPICAAAFAALFGYKVVFYVLHALSGEVKSLEVIVIKLIDRLNIHDKETNKLAKEISILRVEVAALYKCMGVNPKKMPRPKQED